MTSGESSSFFTCMSYIYRYEIPEIRKLDGSIDRSEVYGESSITNKGGKAFAPILSLFISSSRDEIVRQGTNLPLPSALNSFFFFFSLNSRFSRCKCGRNAAVQQLRDLDSLDKRASPLFTCYFVIGIRTSLSLSCTRFTEPLIYTGCANKSCSMRLDFVLSLA